MTSTVTLRRGSQSDIAFVMATERLEGYGEPVGRWEADTHMAALKDGRHAYFIAAAKHVRSASPSCATGARPRRRHWSNASPSSESGKA